MLLAVLLTTVTLHWFYPGFQAANDGCTEGADQAHLLDGKIYRMVQGDASPIFMRSHLATAGAADTAMVPDTPATWFISCTNTIGESCLVGYTIGIPVSVPPWWPKESNTSYDVQGRIVQPGAAGIYFTRHKKRVRLK